MKEYNEIIESLPRAIFIIPMRGCPVFPGLYTTIEVSDKQDIDISATVRSSTASVWSCSRMTTRTQAS